MTEDLNPQDVLEKMVKKFYDTLEEDEKLKDELKGFERDVLINFKDRGDYSFSIKETDISEIEEGKIKDPDITIYTDVDTLDKLMHGEIRPMEAYARKKVKIDASFMDILKIKNLL
ncbi:MAG: SCP2 sterol-binding domain-containing protein [Thermoplasmatota archaeon]